MPVLLVDEAPYSVGQWGAVVSVCLALIAAAINKYNKFKRSTQISRSQMPLRKRKALPQPLPLKRVCLQKPRAQGTKRP